MIDIRKRSHLPWVAKALLAAAVLASSAIGAAAATYPTHTVTIVVPFGPGTVTDTVARLIAEHLRETLGAPFIVENKGGASGMIGATYVARANPDGYTLLFSTNTTQSAIKSLFKEVPYDPLKDFAPIARIVNLPSLVVVNNKLPVKTIQDFVAYAKANPGKLQYGYGNVSGQIAGEMLKRRTGIDMTAVPYRGNPLGLTDLMAGNIAAMVVDTGTGIPQVAAGTVRPLAMITPMRSALLPDLPTLNETVTPRFDLVAWGGVFAPAGTPPEIVATLNKAVGEALKDPKLVARLEQAGGLPMEMTPAQFGQLVVDETEKWRKVVAFAGVSVD